MKSMKLNAFTGYQIPALSEILVLGGISCHDASLIVDAHCQDDQDSSHCQTLCNMDMQCTGDGYNPVNCNTEM